MTTQAKAGEGTLDAGEVRLHYFEWGDPAAPLVVLIHGFGSNARNFDSIAPLIATKHHVLSIDARGHGDSDWAKDGDYSTEAHVRDVEGLRKALGVEKLSIAGTSMGGRITMAYAGLHPDRVERAIINDAGPEIGSAGSRRVAEYQDASPPRFASMEEAIKFHYDHYPSPRIKRMSPAELETFVSYSVRPDGQGGVTWKLDPAARDARNKPSTLDFWQLVRQITAPTVVLRGAESDVLTQPVADRMVREIPNCRLVLVPGVGHSPRFTEPESIGAVKELFGLD